jgi:hypothetical protein
MSRPAMSMLRFILMLPVAFLASCTMHLPAPQVSGQRVETRSMPVAASVDTVPIYLLSDNLHTALAFDMKWLEESGYVKPHEIGDHKWVTMSWGEKTAYVQKRWLNPLQVFRALCTPSPSVMEIIPIDWKVEQVCHHQKVFIADVPRSSGPALAAFLNGCAAKQSDGTPETVAPSSWGNGRLIRCPENYSYYFPRICNVWTAQSLQSCGYSIKTGSALSAKGLVRQATSPQNGFVKIWDPETDEKKPTGPAS